MKKLTNIVRRIKKLNPGKMVKKILSNKDMKDEIIRMNTYDQLYEEGIDSKGRMLGNYSPYTIQLKRMAARVGRDGRTDHITLRDTGKFYDSFKLRLMDDSFVIVANTKKDDVDLVDAYGKEILGLTNENLGYVIQDVKKEVVKMVRKEVLG